MKNNYTVITKISSTHPQSNYSVYTLKSNYNVSTIQSNNSVITPLFSSFAPLKKWGIVLLLFLIINGFSFSVAAMDTPSPLQTNDIQLFNQPEQGDFVYGQLNSAARLFFNDQEIIPTSAGEFVFAVPRNSGQHIDLTLKNKENEQKISFPVTQRHWKKEVVNGLDTTRIQLSPEHQKRVQDENALVRSSRQQAAKTAVFPKNTSIFGRFLSVFGQPAEKPFFLTDKLPACFVRPVDSKARISSVFGSQRLLNGIEKHAHTGTDYALPMGSPVYAVQEGVVLLAHPDLFYTGQTILIDHGYGIISSYSHLNQIDIQTGDFVKRGQIIGAVGSSGRSTGPHLHFVMSWHQIRVDSESVFKKRLCPIPPAQK